MNPLFARTRLQLAGYYAAVMGCLLGLSGFGVYQVVVHDFQETIDEGLVSASNSLRTSLEPVLQQPEELRQLAHQLSLELCHPPAACKQPPQIQSIPIAAKATPVDYYLRLVNLRDQPVALAGLPLNRLPLTSERDRVRTVTNLSGEPYRQISVPLYLQNQMWGYLQIGRSLNDMEEHLTKLRLTLLLGCPLALLLVVGSGWWLSGLAMQPIYRSYDQMRQFTADAAHELRTPLASMQATIDAALIEPQPSTEEGVLSILKRQNLRLSQLVRDLLLLVRLDQQTMPENRSRCCLNDIVADLLEEMASLAVAAQVKLTAQITISETVEILANEQQIYRLICNLIDNAIQATPVDGSVTVGLGQNEGDAVVWVEDTGVGIAPEDQLRIFHRFYRVQLDRSRHSGGSGLGLAIARAIVQAHQGSIQVQTAPALGSTFTVRLPLN